MLLNMKWRDNFKIGRKKLFLVLILIIIVKNKESGTQDQYEIFVNEMMSKELEKLSNSVEQNQELALNKLVDCILNIETSLHKNFR